MQEWVKATGAKICIVFEGRDTAGKGGTIKRITERVSPRVFRVMALPPPTPREKSQMYVQRYIPHFPAAGEVVIFDRSWYNRAGRRAGDGLLHARRGRTVPRASAGGREGDGRFGDPAVRSIGWRSAPTSRPGGSRAASTTHARSGSYRTWICCPTVGGTTTPAPATPCSRRRTRHGRPGSWLTAATRSAAATQHHLPPPRPHPLRAAPSPGCHAAPPCRARWLHRA